VLPVSDTAARRSFVLYEESGSVQVSTFVGEDWLCRQTFHTCQRAVAAIIETATLVSPPAPHASSTSRTTRARSSVR
jgi:hypothetical protein